MKLKRQYTADEAGATRCTRVRVVHTGMSAEQNFSDRLVAGALLDGWMRREGDVLIITADPEDLAYTVKREPGYYCKSSGERIPITAFAWARMKTTGLGDITQREAVAWLLSRGKAADDYEVTNAFECVLDTAQHHKYHAVRDVAGNVVAACAVEG